MKHRSFLQRSIINGAAAVAFAGAVPAFAAAPVAALTMTSKFELPADFIANNSARTFVRGTIGAQVKLLDDGVFTINSPRLPLIVGRWTITTSQTGKVTCFWAKTDQIDFNGTVLGADKSGNPIVLYSVQVNAPRTDGPGGSGTGTMAPASFQCVQLWTLTSGGGAGIGSGGGAAKR
jgi:hypothetical protein